MTAAVRDHSYAVVADELFAPLMNAASPGMFRLNLFRVLGLSSRATDRDIKKQIDRLRMMEKLGEAMQIDGPLPLNPPPDKEMIEAALQRARDPEQRLIDELFWFWPEGGVTNGQSSPALTALRQRNSKGAIDIWTRQASAGDNLGIAQHNLAVLFFAEALDLELAGESGQLSGMLAAQRDSYWHEGFTNWRGVLTNEGFWRALEARIVELDDPRLTTLVATEIRASLPLCLLSLNLQLAVRATQQKRGKDVERHRALVDSSGFPADVIEVAIRRGLTPLWGQLKMICQTAEKETEEKPSEGNTTARKLLEQARPLLVTFDNLLAEGHSLRDDARDEVARAAWGCGIVYGNETKEWETCVDLIERIRPYAIAAALREKIDEGLKTAKENIEQKTLSKCWFCRETEGDEFSKCEVPMYGNVKRTYLGNATRVEWQKLKVPVPRCLTCFMAHKRSSRFLSAGVGLGILGGVLLSIITYAAMGAPSIDPPIFFGSVFLFITSLVLGISVGGTLSKISNPTNVKDVSERVRHPSVTQMNAQGWKVGERP